MYHKRKRKIATIIEDTVEGKKASDIFVYVFTSFLYCDNTTKSIHLQTYTKAVFHRSVHHILGLAVGWKSFHLQTSTKAVFHRPVHHNLGLAVGLKSIHLQTSTKSVFHCPVHHIFGLAVGLRLYFTVVYAPFNISVRRGVRVPLCGKSNYEWNVVWLNTTSQLTHLLTK